MIIETFYALNHALPMLVDWVYATATGGDGSQLLWASPVATGPAAGGGTYYAVYKRYRNQDATYRYEHDTRVELKNVGGYDHRIDHRSRTTDQSTPNMRQSLDPRDRVHGKPSGLGGFFGMLG